MNKKLQVFVSSTYTDLKEERQAAVQAILDAGHIPAGMELFKAGKSQMETIRKWIDESDVYMLILGGRYGSIEEESGLSYTELEYKYALSKNMPVFAIILDDSFLSKKSAINGKDAIFEKDNTDKYDTFKKFLKNQIVRFVSNIDQIASVVHSHLNDIINDEDFNLIGWIHPSKNTNYEKLLSENKSLKKQLQDLRNNSNQDDSHIQIKGDEYKQRYLDVLAKYPQETPFDLLENKLSTVYITYMNKKYTALDFFKMQYINNQGSTSTIKKAAPFSYMQKENFNNIFIDFEKFNLIICNKHEKYNLYTFTLSKRGYNFCEYLCSKQKSP